MPIIQTAKDLGLAIRSRRRELGWDQATLAKHTGVTRQWVIDIEKGKPRAELALAMRALRVLGLSLIVETSAETASKSSAETGQAGGARTPQLDIDAIVESNRGSVASRLSSNHRSAEPSASRMPKTAAEYLEEIEALKR